MLQRPLIAVQNEELFGKQNIRSETGQTAAEKVYNIVVYANAVFAFLGLKRDMYKNVYLLGKTLKHIPYLCKVIWVQEAYCI